MLRQRGIQQPEKDITQSPPMSEAEQKPKSKTFLIVSVATLFVLYVVVPICIYSCPLVRQHIVFLHYVSLSEQKNLSSPQTSGLNCTRNFLLPAADNIEIGVWHIPPHSKCGPENATPKDSNFNDDRPVFLYLHGNAGTRSGNHRVQLYKVLSRAVDAHVVAFDYRGFGDSSGSPSEPGLVEDTKSVFDWLIKKGVETSRVYVWGHSLGTGVGVAFMEKMLHVVNGPRSLILEAPFTRIVDAAEHHPLSIFHRYMPFFDMLIAKPIGGQDTGFNSIDRIGKLRCSLLVLHAEDDGFVPYEHGRKLYEEALKAREKSDSKNLVTRFVGFEGALDFGHKNIYRSPELPSVVKSFISEASAV